jgi:hypothetical protein
VDPDLAFHSNAVPDSDSPSKTMWIRIRNPGLNGHGCRINVANSCQDFSARPAERYDAGEFFLTFMNGNKNLFEENMMKIRPQICLFFIPSLSVFSAQIFVQ